MTKRPTSKWWNALKIWLKTSTTKQRSTTLPRMRWTSSNSRSTFYGSRFLISGRGSSRKKPQMLKRRKQMVTTLSPIWSFLKARVSPSTWRRTSSVMTNATSPHRFSRSKKIMTYLRSLKTLRRKLRKLMRWPKTSSSGRRWWEWTTGAFSRFKRLLTARQSKTWSPTNSETIDSIIC